MTSIHNNIYIDDVIKLENSYEFRILMDIVNKKLSNYFSITYKRLSYDDFIETNDYFIQNIKYFIYSIKKVKFLDFSRYGQCLQNFILSIEKPIIISVKNTIVKSAISNFIIKNKQQLSLLHQLKEIENKGINNSDYILLLEKLSVLIKSIFDIAINNTKHKLYIYIENFLTKDKFLEERKNIFNRNKIKMNKTQLNIVTHDYFFNDFKILSEKKINLFRSNTKIEDECLKDDNMIFEHLELINLLEEDREEFKYTMEPQDPNQLNLFTPLETIIDCEISKKSAKKDQDREKTTIINDFNKQLQLIITKDFMSDSSFRTKPSINKASEDNMSNFIDKFMKNSRKIKNLLGDKLPVPEFDDNIFNEKNQIEYKINVINSCVNNNQNDKLNNISNARRSTVIKLISKEERKLIRERSPTPENDKIERSDSPKLKRSLSKILQPKQNNYQVNNKRTSKLFPIYSNNNSIIKVPPNFFTIDPDLKFLCDLMNEPTDKVWKIVIENPNIKIHKRSIEGLPQILIKTQAFLNDFTKEEIFEAISNVNIRMEWDKIFSEFKIIETNAPSILVKDRDFVQKRKIWKDFPNSDSVVIHFKSVTHELAPEYPKFVRAETIISGYYIKTLSLNPVKTLVAIIAQTDIKGSIPTWVVNSVSQKAPKEWVNNLMKGCEKIRANKSSIYK